MVTCMKSIKFLIALTSLLFSSITFAMDNEDIIYDYFSYYKRPDICIEKADELNNMIYEYKSNGTPISLAVACGSKEMPKKIIKGFHSEQPVNEQWIALDLLLTDDSPAGAPHIRMDATNRRHWEQFAQYLKDNGIEVSTVAFTAFGPPVNSEILREIIMPIVKKGGHLVYPNYFSVNHCNNPEYSQSADRRYFGTFMIRMRNKLIIKGCFNGKDCSTFFSNTLKGYYIDENSGYFQDRQALEEHIMKWDQLQEMQPAERDLAAKVFINRAIHYNILEGQYADPLNHDANVLFSRTPDEFSRDYIDFFRDYMTKIGFNPTSYKIYSKSYYGPEEINLIKFYGTEPYVYPKDGTFNFLYGGGLSLVLIKQ